MLIAVLENPKYIDNIGNVIRNVNALGVDRLYVVDGLKRLEDDPEALKNRRSLLKMSKGAVKWTEIRRFDTTSACFESLRGEAAVSVGTSPHAIGRQSIALPVSNLTAPQLAIWFGDEANGLSPEALGHCDFCVRIEMNGAVESLNLATTTGIVLYEAVRQRRKP